jgi:outer membrane receptor protein involved in Fe transport
LAGLTVPPVVGSALPGTPKNSLALGFEYGHLPIAGGEMRYAIDGHYQSSMIPSISATVPTAAGYTMLNTRASFTRDHWTGTLYVDNLTNVLGINAYTEPAGYGNRYAAIVSRPRTTGVTMGYSFK